MGKLTDEQIDKLWFEAISAIDEAMKRPRTDKCLRKHIREMAEKKRKERDQESPRLKLKRLKHVILQKDIVR